MRVRTTVLMVSVLGALVLLPYRASAQETEKQIEAFRVEMPLPSVVFSHALPPGWWRVVTDTLDAMHGLRGRRIPPLTASQVDFDVAATPIEWQRLPPVMQGLPHHLELRLDGVLLVPVPFEPFTASLVDLRGESGELLGAEVTLPRPASVDAR